MGKCRGELTKIAQYCGKLTFLKKTVNLGVELRISEKLAGELSAISPLRGGAIKSLSPVYVFSYKLGLVFGRIDCT